MQELEADPAYQEQKRKADAYWAEKRKLLDEDQREIVAKINAVGIPIKQVSDLLSMRTPYPAAIPILLDQLDQPHMPNVKDMIARSLAVPEAEYAHAQILAQLRTEVVNAREEKGMQVILDGLAVAVALTKPKKRLHELLEHARDESLGDSRLLFLMRLRRSHNPDIVQGLIDLASHQLFQKEIKSWRGFCKKHALEL